MNDDRLTERLAGQVFKWRVMPDRFIVSGRSWIPRWRFRPLTELADAFRLLDHAADRYSLRRDGATFTAEVHIGSCEGKAAGEHMARTITVAVARALRLDVDERLATFQRADASRKKGERA
jgi:hypothetical protein